MKEYTVFFIADKTEFYLQLKQQLKKINILVNRLPLVDNDSVCIKADLPHLIVLVCSKQEISELNICRKIRDMYQGLVVVITEPGDRDFQFLALDLGADAFLTTSDGAVLIAASIKALLRRFIPEEPLTQLHFGDLTIDRTKRDAFLGDKAVDLSTIEFLVLWSLGCQSGCVVSREEIHKDIYHEIYNGYDRNIDLYISRIRQKIGDIPASPRYLKTVRGVGYQFVGTEK